ncbi:hypothetical protein OESDEN_21275, partial [Oesophagostomum dentatum]
RNFLDFLSRFREDVLESVRSDTEVIVASYDRSQLKQTGTGHFSPLAAYHSQSDKVLIMDVARFKYPPHWVTLSQLQQAMCTLDSSTKRPRGVNEYLMIFCCYDDINMTVKPCMM